MARIITASLILFPSLEPATKKIKVTMALEVLVKQIPLKTYDGDLHSAEVPPAPDVLLRKEDGENVENHVVFLREDEDERTTKIEDGSRQWQ